MHDRPIENVLDLTDPARNRLDHLSLGEARARVAGGRAEDVRSIAGSFALWGREGTTVRLARSLDRPLRYFLAKQAAGPLLVLADRIDRIRDGLAALGLEGQFQPSYTRMVPAHHVVSIRLLGCPDPDPSYERFFAPERNALPADPGRIGRLYVEALAAEIAAFLRSVPESEPLGVCFSGGVDSGAVLLVTHHVLRRLGMSPARLKAFTLSAGEGPDLAQALEFLERLDLAFLLEPIEVDPRTLDPLEAVRVIEDYKPLDVEAATVGLALCRGIRARYPEWTWLLDGDGGDENLKDYPIEDNPELTIRSVLSNPLLYQEGWGVGTIKHSLTYAGGQSRSCTRTYAPLTKLGFEGFSPFMRPSVIAVAEGAPFIDLTGWRHDRLYALKGEIVASGVEAVTGLAMPVFPKRRFQDGAAAPAERSWRLGEASYRAALSTAYA